MAKIQSGKILVVDDESSSRLWVRAALKGWGLEIKELASGQELHQTLQSFQPDLLFLDFQMPGKDGMMLCQELRKYNQTTNVIFFSSTIESDLLQQAYASGFQDYLGKPASLAELRQKVEYWLTADPT